MKKYLNIFLAVLILFSSLFLGIAAEQKSTLEIPEGFTGIISYGSLISVPSMEKTLGHK